MIMHVRPEYAPYHGEFFRRSGHDNYFVSVESFRLSRFQNLPGVARSVDQKPAEAIDQASALPKTQLSLLALGAGQFCREFAAIFASHDPLEMLADGRNRTNVFAERFGAIDYAH